MSFTPQPKDAELALATFGGLVTESDPTNIPEGVSPDCLDMQFRPGSVQSRDGLGRIFATPFGHVTFTYAKSYVDNKGVIRNLYLDSSGNLWVENVTDSPGTTTLLTTTTPHSYGKSVTAFGREYIAFNDGLHGTDIPLQLSYDSDGNAQLDRVTQDGPGASPSISNLILPPVAIAPSASPLSLALVEIDPENADPDSGFFTSINVYTSSAVTDVSVGQTVTIVGTGTPFDGTWGPVNRIFSGTPNSLIQISAYIPAGTAFWVGAATMDIQQGALQRQSNTVTGTTGAPHQLQPGYQVQITNAAAGQIGVGITGIVIDNENLPGIATVYVALAAGQANHGLIPGLFVSITGVQAISVGGTISTIKRAGEVVTVVMNAATGLTPGSVVTISGVSTASFNTTVPVANVTTTTNTGDTFTFLQADSDATDTGGFVGINWPIPETATPTYFEVLSAPTVDSFQVGLHYADAAWITGRVSYAWNGIFYVQTVPTPTTFTYQQYGPDATAAAITGSIIASPHGQVSPGRHQMQVLFLTRQDYITRPSPPVEINCVGGQYLSVTNIPIGPSNVKARILVFTGARGAYFFYLPTAPQVNGQIVGTSTQIDDNTRTSAVLDFGDNSLFAAIGISVPGNNLANQIVLDGALGFGFYASRLLTYGQRNTIQNLLNMGFDGGYFAPIAPATEKLPTGWNVFDAVGAPIPPGQLVNGHYGDGYAISVAPPATVPGNINQSFYQDYAGAPIGQPDTQYKVRVWLRPSVVAADVDFKVAIVSSGFEALAVVNGADMSLSGSWFEVGFDKKTPAVIPPDMILAVYAQSTATTMTLLVDELSIIYSQTPYTDTILNGSYVDNPEAFDGVSGPFGPSQDTHKVMDFGVIRETLYLLTQDPSGRLHEVVNNGITEPAGWSVEEVASNCGAVSAYSLTRSQADDSSASGGEEWFAWASYGQARIFGGGEPWKISQEIQPDWDTVNKSAALTVWSLNDPVKREIYFGLPTGAHTAPDQVYHLNYRELDSASEIAHAAPVHVGLNGKLSAHDNARKWCPWSMTMNGAALMYRAAGVLKAVFFGGDGERP